MSIKFCFLSGLFFLVGISVFAQPMMPEQEESVRTRFVALQQLNWKEVFEDSGHEDWQQKWFLDGVHAKVENSPEGMIVHAGPTAGNNAHHAVLWTKEVFETENLKIEYLFTRLDTSTANTVNILYILAQGGGGKPLDISDWNHERREPAMSKYFNGMDTYHISYAVSGIGSAPEAMKYIRGRRYMPSQGRGLTGTELFPEYLDVPLFESGVTYKMTLIKPGRELFLHVTGNGKENIFYFDASDFPPVDKGRIGLRQMSTRVSRYADFKFWKCAPEPSCTK